MSSSVSTSSVESVLQTSMVRHSLQLEHLERRRRPASNRGAADVRPEAAGFLQGLGTFYHPPSSALCRSASPTWKEDQSKLMSSIQVKSSAAQNYLQKQPGKHRCHDSSTENHALQNHPGSWKKNPKTFALSELDWQKMSFHMTELEKAKSFISGCTEEHLESSPSSPACSDSRTKASTVLEDRISGREILAVFLLRFMDISVAAPLL